MTTKQKNYGPSRNLFTTILCDVAGQGATGEGPLFCVYDVTLYGTTAEKTLGHTAKVLCGHNQLTPRHPSASRRSQSSATNRTVEHREERHTIRHTQKHSAHFSDSPRTAQTPGLAHWELAPIFTSEDA